MSDLPCDELNGKTPMEAASKPTMDRLACASEAGLVKSVPDSLPPGSDVANLSILGYNPEECYTGRSPLEAASMGIEMDADDVAIRCNIVSLSKEDSFHDAVMNCYCANDIHTPEAAKVIEIANQEFGSEKLKFYPGISYRHCLIIKNGKIDLDMTPPHDITGKRIGDYIKIIEKNQFLYEIMEKSYFLDNSKCLWFWGEGKRAELPLFREKFGLSSVMISAVDLLKGIGKLTGMEVINVPGATGYIDTNFTGKANAAINALENGADLAYIHIEAPDECGHRGEVNNKVKSIELIDELVLKPVLKVMDGEHLRVLIAPDHPTPLSLKTHTRDPVPFLIYDNKTSVTGVSTFTEKTAKSTGIYIENGYELMERFTNARN